MKKTSLPKGITFYIAIFALVTVWAGSLQAEPLTPQQLASIQNVGAIQISQDARFILYTRTVPVDPLEDNARNRTELYLIDREDDTHTQIEMESRAGNIAVRPDHGTFSFTSNKEDDDFVTLYELDPVSGDISQVYAHFSNISAYSWHPSGNALSVISMEQLDLPENPLPYEPTFYEENIPNREGYLVDLTADDPEARRIQIDGTIYIMTWSPNGDRLAISETPTPNIDDYYMFQQVKIVDPETAEVTVEIDNAGKLGQITWSPDGSLLALRAGNSIHDPIDGRIMIVSSDGGTPENIYPDFNGKFEQINWTDDGQIRFIASESTARSFGTINPDGSGFERRLGIDSPVLNRFVTSDDGTVVFSVQTPSHPSEVYLLDADNDELVRLTHSNEWLDEVPMGRQVVVSYEARDGRNIEGLLIYPVEETGGPYPTIVMVHGGPEAHYSNGWLTGYSLPGQVAAGRGFATFYPNYRGSTGRGIEFIKSSQSDLAGAEFDDIVDGVDYLIRQGITDADRVGVTGGSYGGYATAWMSTRYSHRFAAGVMFVGISNNISKWGTSDIPEELYLVHSRKRLWDHWQWNLERSPIYHVENAQTPLLIMHGEEDTRVHPAQSLELYRHIKVRKPEVPLRLVWYPDEGHGNVHSTSRFDYNLRMLRWFETFLAEEPVTVKPDSWLDLEALGVQLNQD
ncbi:S9 family peptidase [Balneolales bacterium ANBcel1]|nr:S9 family peptidase [Balneolales bacterium ANBcel1]